MVKRMAMEYNLPVMDNFRKLETEVSDIGRYGAAVLKLTAEDFYGAGYEPGDLVEVAVAGSLFTVPVGTSYTDVDHGQVILLKIEFEDRMLLAVNNNNTFVFDYGIRIGDPVSISMVEKAGYLKEYRLRSLTMGETREQYPSDEAFCNFRAVHAGKMKENYLYRGFSPINPTENRADQTDRLLSQTGIKTVINLDGEDETARKKYAGYKERHYADLVIVPVKMNFSSEDAAFASCIYQVAAALIREEGPFYIHCRYGRDRTGLVCMILEALCEASFKEIVLDYMLSYENIHGLERFSEKWNRQMEKRVVCTFEELTGVHPSMDMNGQEMKCLVEERLLGSCGFSRELLDELEEKLCMPC